MLAWLRHRGPPFSVQENLLSPTELDALREAILQSRYLAENPLNYRFEGTLGFSLAFRASALERVRQDFPAFGPYLDRVLDPAANAFYLNPLIVRSGARVGRHMDRSLRSYCRPLEPPAPRVVTVLYLEVPPGMQGGELCLYDGDRPLQRIVPQPNLLLRFGGHLSHEVAEARYDGTEALRLSLVCEQYALPGWLHRRVPSFTIQSTSSFQAFLDEELSRETEPETAVPEPE